MADLTSLKNDLEAGFEFVIKLRAEREWDKEAFDRLTCTMKLCCEHQATSETLERWMAWDFWYIPWFVRTWTAHPDFRRNYNDKYYDRACQRLDELAYWFFTGESPHLGNTGVEVIR